MHSNPNYVKFLGHILALTSVAGLAGASADAQSPPSPEPLASVVAIPEASWPVVLRQQIARLAVVEWKLREAAGSACASTDAATGIKLDFIGAYTTRDHEMIVRDLGLSDAPQVATVVPGSPADEAGLRPGDAVLEIDGKSTATLLAINDDPATFADSLEERIAALPQGKLLTLRLERAGTILTTTVSPLRRCSTRFILKTDRSIDAYSDGTNVAVTSGLIAFARTEDELALIAGHELAHVVHRDGKAKSLAHRRRMEDRADLLGAALAHCADYDVGEGLKFWTRFKQRDWLGFLRDPTHRSVPARIQAIDAAIPTATCPPAPELLAPTT